MKDEVKLATLIFADITGFTTMVSVYIYIYPLTGSTAFAIVKELLKLHIVEKNALKILLSYVSFE